MLLTHVITHLSPISSYISYVEFYVEGERLLPTTSIQFRSLYKRSLYLGQEYYIVDARSDQPIKLSTSLPPLIGPTYPPLSCLISHLFFSS